MLATRTVENVHKFPAGVELLSRYEDTWAALHKGTKESAKAGELVDSEVVMLFAYWEKKRSSLKELQDQLQQIPGFLADLESMTAKLSRLEENFENMESRLLELEDLCGQCELENFKRAQSIQLENYKKKKRKELEAFKAELDAEHTQKVLAMEHAQQMKLKERQKFFEEAFQQDMEQYLSTGYLQITERRGSGFEICQNEVSVQVPSQSELQQKLSSLSSNHTSSACQEASEEGGNSPIVQSDEEEVHVDTALAAVTTDTKANSDVSDESDSQTM
ncbi:dysbindin isoform X2 [Rhinatrema bivittatum]|uniref:dysbindin isoform X2 n=1 Tax=Rhinatrema bivittatum TaxID=194408 RepID=UPI00112EF119|nr:dysbindin isoform X2 [Rhinatrema bivittatum]